MLKRILIIPDTHVPYHDKKAWKLMLKAAAVFKPHKIVIMGDFLDAYPVSSHSKDPTRENQLEYEIDATIECLEQLGSLKAEEKFFIEGNHEDRLSRYLQDNAPALYNTVKIDKLLGLKERKWKFVPYKSHVKIGRVYYTHDIGSAGKTAHTNALSAYQDNVVIGHVHRILYSVEGSVKGKPHVGACFGWLGDVNEIDYMHKAKALRDWSLGFGIGYLDESNGYTYLQPVPIVDYTCIMNGKLIK